MEKRSCKPYQNIQNGANWCWVVAAKLVGNRFLYPDRSMPDKDERSKQDKLIKVRDGFRRKYLGFEDGQYTVDQEQYNIVQNISPDDIQGSFSGDDECKRKALLYTVTGDVNSSELKVKNIGNFKGNLLEDRIKNIAYILQHKIAFIGNFSYIHSPELVHSVMCQPINEREIYMYDPWDGYAAKFTVAQIFQTGFLTNRGAGKISWLQYIAK